MACIFHLAFGQLNKVFLLVRFVLYLLHSRLKRRIILEIITSFSNLNTMDKVLPSDFSYDNYGIHARFVTEDDAEFILSLRTNLKLSRYIHSTDKSVEKQKQWIKDYKDREREGLEYYFIYDDNGNNIGVNRIYNIKDNSCTGGSWICSQDAESSKSIATILCLKNIMFDILGFTEEYFDVRIDNIQVQKLHLMLGAIVIGKTDKDILFKLSCEDYYRKRERIITLLKLNILN